MTDKTTSLEGLSAERIREIATDTAFDVTADAEGLRTFKFGEETVVDFGKAVVRALLSASPTQSHQAGVAAEPTWTVGNLLTLSDSNYPGMGRYFAQVWQGDDLIARVDGDSHEQVSERAERIAAAPQLPATAAVEHPEKLVGGTAEQQARYAIDGAIQYGRENRNPPPSTDHWLYEYWNIGRQLAKLGETGWDNVTPATSSERLEQAPVLVDAHIDRLWVHSCDVGPDTTQQLVRHFARAIEREVRAAPAAGEHARIPVVVLEAVEAAFEDQPGWREKMGAAVRALADEPEVAGARDQSPDLAARYDRLLAAAQNVVDEALDDADSRMHPCDVRNDEVKAQHTPAPVQALFYAIRALRSAPGTPTAANQDHLPGWERGIATVTLSGHQLREALDFINPDGDDDTEQREEALTFGIVKHKADDGAEAVGMCCWNDDTDGVLPLDGVPGTPGSEIGGGQ